MTPLQNHTRVDKPYYEFLWARQLARKELSLADYLKWRSYRSVDRLYVELGTVFVHWGWQDGEAKALKIYTLSGVTVNAEGVTYDLEDASGKHYQTGHTPKLLASTGIFFWVPHFNEFRHLPEDWKDATGPGSLRMCMCVWQPGNPNKERLETHTYMTTENLFQDQWAGTTIYKG